MRLALAQLNSLVGDLAGNGERIVDAARQAHRLGADLLLTPADDYVASFVQDVSRLQVLRLADIMVPSKLTTPGRKGVAVNVANPDECWMVTLKPSSAQGCSVRAPKGHRKTRTPGGPRGLCFLHACLSTLHVHM